MPGVPAVPRRRVCIVSISRSMKMRELTQSELNAVSGGEWNCGVTIELPPSISVGCTGSGPDWQEAWNRLAGSME